MEAIIKALEQHEQQTQDTILALQCQVIELQDQVRGRCTGDCQAATQRDSARAEISNLRTMLQLKQEQIRQRDRAAELEEQYRRDTDRVALAQRYSEWLRARNGQSH